MEDFDNDKYHRALKKMKDIKGFYSHLVVYLVVNLLLILAHMGIFTHGFVNIDIASKSFFMTPFFWGIGLFFHGLYVFQHKFRFFKDWEERKIKQYMEKDEEDFKNTTNWD
ncbi:MAG: 2TM domain-containing protein [Bacteroidetes bacterium]|nr:2TM domain-containing protein [Bacteroidota bacterium]